MSPTLVRFCFIHPPCCHCADISAPGVTYTASVGVGSPATDYTLLIDTGSSNTWVGAQKKYKKTSTSKDTGKGVVRTVCQCLSFFSPQFCYQERELWVWFLLWNRVYVVVIFRRLRPIPRHITSNCFFRYGSGGAVFLPRYQVPEYRCCIYCSGLQ